MLKRSFFFELSFIIEEVMSGQTSSRHSSHDEKMIDL